VVVNNHRSFWSTSYMAMRAMGNNDGSYGTRNADIKRLFRERGFTCQAGYSLGIWPQTDFRSFVLPWPATLAVERFNLRYLARLHSTGYNTVFLFKKMS